MASGGGEGRVGGEELAPRFECISITQGKMKYMNPAFKKVQAKAS